MDTTESNQTSVRQKTAGKEQNIRTDLQTLENPTGKSVHLDLSISLDLLLSPSAELFYSMRACGAAARIKPASDILILTR